MKKFWLLIFFYVLPAYSQPVVPNFVTGTMSSTTNTTTSITETITSKDYKTGYEYTVSGTGITNSGGDMSPNATTVNGSSGGVTYTWTGADLTTKPNWTLNRYDLWGGLSVFRKLPWTPVYKTSLQLPDR